ncbi:hypothetical protein BRADI_5g06821v3 [Brachypodium distachyon]|uniref:Uncharacterized protein n=1 Tax=Brachypodium distachyon TaxID=15368 RepID=A0A2K2CFQ4_BRADI|nr:hypothetical protein BRADI_5g06821v3 [Brachypodium distachyon]
MHLIYTICLYDVDAYFPPHFPVITAATADVDSAIHIADEVVTPGAGEGDVAGIDPAKDDGGCQEATHVEGGDAQDGTQASLRHPNPLFSFESPCVSFSSFLRLL